MGSLRAELGKLRERLQGELSQNGDEEPEVSGKPAAEAVWKGRSVVWLEVGRAALLSSLHLRELGGPGRASCWLEDTQLGGGSTGSGTQYSPCSSL